MTTAALPPELATYLRGSGVALALAELSGDSPLILVNQTFCDLTGYGPAEVQGRNCRFLQGDADNREARAAIRQFFDSPRQESVRTSLLNFRKDGAPFVNLLYMSRLTRTNGAPPYILASQFDVSRARPDLLEDYDAQLSGTLDRMRPVLAETGIIVEGSLLALASSAAMIAQARLLLSSLNKAAPGG